MSLVSRYLTGRSQVPDDPRDGDDGIGHSFIVVARSDDVLQAVDGPPLSPASAARRSRLVRTQDRDDFTAARRVALLLMGFLHNSPPSNYEIHQMCGVCGGPHGRPSIPNPSNWDVSWAHDQGVVAAAVGPGRIGVDVLLATPRAGDGDLHLDGPQIADLEVITRAEALVKVGSGNLDDLLGKGAQLGTQGSSDNVYLSDNNQRVVVESANFDGVIVSVASTRRARFVMLIDLLTLPLEGIPAFSQTALQRAC